MVIAFSGKAGVGKTTAAKFLNRYYGFKIISFASPLKTLASQMFPFEADSFTAVRKKQAPFKKYDWSPRQFLVNLGAFLRYHDQDYFVKALQQQLVDNPDDNFVIDDLRFQNEAKMLEGLGATIIRINRYQKDNPYKSRSNDASQIGLDTYSKFAYTIHQFQNKNVAILTQKLDKIMKDLEVETTD